MNPIVKLNFIAKHRIIYTKDVTGHPGQAFNLRDYLTQLPKNLKNYYVSNVNNNCSIFSKNKQTISIYVKPYIKARLNVGTATGHIQSYPLLARQHKNRVNLHDLLSHVIPPHYQASKIKPALNKIKNNTTYNLTITPIKSPKTNIHTKPSYANSDDSRSIKANCTNKITFIDLKSNQDLKSIVMSGEAGKRIKYLDKVPDDYQLVNPRRLSYKPNAKYILLLRPRQHKMVTSYIVYFDYLTKKLLKYQTITGLQNHPINYKALFWDRIKDGTYHLIKFGSHHKTFTKGSVNVVWIIKSSDLTTVSNYYIDYHSNQLIKHTLKHYIANHYFNITTDKVLSHKYVIDKINYYYTHQHITNMIFISAKANLKSDDTVADQALIQKIRNKSTALARSFRMLKRINKHDANRRKQATTQLHRLQTKNYNLQHVINHTEQHSHVHLANIANAAGVCFIIGFLLSCLVIALS